MSEEEADEVLTELVRNSWDRMDETSPNLEVQFFLWSTTGVEMFKDEARMGTRPEETEEGFEKEVRRMKLGILDEMWKLCTSTLGELRVQSAHSSQQQRDTMQVAYDLAGVKAEDRQAQYEAQVYMAAEHEKTERTKAFMEKLPLIARLVNAARAKPGGNQPSGSGGTEDGSTDGGSTVKREQWVDDALRDIRGGAGLETLIEKYGTYFADTERFDAALATLTPEEADLVAAATGAPARE